MIETLEVGRDAFKRHAWAEAIESLTAADAGADGGLKAEDLEQLGMSYWWAGRPDEATTAFERAFAAYKEAARPEDAARMALELGYRAFRSNMQAVGGGWLGQAAQLLAGAPESGVHAWLGVFQGILALFENRIEEGIAITERTMEQARRLGNLDALNLAMSFRGRAEIDRGNIQAGLALMDASAAAAATGELDLRVASDLYCNVIGACRDIGDLDRAGQWAAEGERWMLRNGSGGFPGICRVHRAEIKMLHGQWAEAEQESRQACEELRRYRLFDGVGSAQYQIGEIRLRMGDLEAAAEAFDEAYEYGHHAQPGLALLQLARGEVDDARRSIERALESAAGTGGVADRPLRARLLPAAVDIRIAAGDLSAAGRAVEELEAIAGDYAKPLFQAGAMTARGELLLGEEKATEASPVLGRSWRLWQSSDLPYESARARLHYAEAIAAEGDISTARRDLGAARAAFERLGATRDIDQVDRLLAGLDPRGSRAAADAGPGTGPVSPGEGSTSPASRGARTGERLTKTFMFTDVVGSTDLVGLIGDEAWGEILRWHDRELRAAFAEHAGEEVSHTGDGFFVAFARPADGIEAAVDIQRRLVRHRREHGFAPWIRIGLHAAEATRQGRNYTGGGVHVAARVGAAAGKDEILVSRSVIDGAGRVRFGMSDPREIALKGVKEPVEVRSVEWR